VIFGDIACVRAAIPGLKQELIAKDLPVKITLLGFSRDHAY
jgi:hypothetical protein